MKREDKIYPSEQPSVREQLGLYASGPVEKVSNDVTSTFSDNMSLPIHRWFRYSAGFSARWANQLIRAEKVNGRQNVLDPFVGSGTVLLEAEKCGAYGIGIEAHPFVARLAGAKLLWREEVSQFKEFGLVILEQARRLGGVARGYPKLIEKCYPDAILSRLDALRRAWQETSEDSPFSELTWLTLTSILRECSPVGTAQWQYVLPNKAKARALDPFKAFEEKIYLMSNDMLIRQNETLGETAILHIEDARSCESISDNWADLVITSPPYANNYDYADATRLEMSFWGEVRRWGDLQDKVRKYLIRSCTQHVARNMADTHILLKDNSLIAIRREITQVCNNLEIEREKHGGKKPYHTMIASYFLDLARVWDALRRVVKDGGRVCFVVGDSAPYGIYVPVDRWLGELAIASGFRSYRFEKLRDRNVKWKNRKHRVPLHEGRLWIEA